MCSADAVDAVDAADAGESVVKTVLKLFSQRSTAHKYYFSPMTSGSNSLDYEISTVRPPAISLSFFQKHCFRIVGTNKGKEGRSPSPVF